MDVAWKIPLAWTRLRLCDRTALYPALCLSWAGHKLALGRSLPPGQWRTAGLRVLVCDQGLADDERELLALTAARGLGAIVAPQGGLGAADRDFIAGLGMATLAWTDSSALASAPPQRPADRVLQASGCAARLAEDIALASVLGKPWPQPPTAVDDGTGLVIVAEDAAALAEIAPALERWSGPDAGRIGLVCQDPAARDLLAGPVRSVDPADPQLLERIARAAAVLCAMPKTPVDSPRPGQWVRSALFAGAPVIAASHPSIDGLAQHCVMDDWERGLKLGRLADLRLEAAVAGQAFLAPRLDPEPIAREWLQLASAARPARPRPALRATPLLMVLLDVFGDLDLMAPLLEALARRGEVRLRILVSDWLAEGSPRTTSELTARGFAFEIVPREALRAGQTPSLAGVDGVLTGADTTARAHKAGHTLTSRARRAGLPTFTLQHGFENIGLTYKDQLHGADIRLAAETIFTWCEAQALADWVPAQTRAAVVPIGSPKAAPPPARAAALGQGHWERSVGVFENLHWRRFSEAYRTQLLADLEAAAETHPQTLFLVKPHHAGRWLSTHPERIRQRANLVVVDPTDSAWEPHTAPALIAGLDAVLTTPSTVALDAARSGRPTGVLGYDLDLPLYEPLPIIRSLAELQAFLAADEDEGLRRNEAFLRRAILPGRADHRIAARIAAALRRPTRRSRLAAAE